MMPNNYNRLVPIILGLIVWLCVSTYVVNRQLTGQSKTDKTRDTIDQYDDEINIEIYNTNIKHEVSIRQGINDGRRYPIRGSALISMFTTIKASSVRNSIHKNTINNWAALGIDRYLFVDEHTHDWAKKAFLAGWNLAYLSKSHLREGFPILKHMFRTMEAKVDSPYIGYANADIVFDRYLIYRKLSLLLVQLLQITQAINQSNVVSEKTSKGGFQLILINGKYAQEAYKGAGGCVEQVEFNYMYYRC